MLSPMASKPKIIVANKEMARGNWKKALLSIDEVESVWRGEMTYVDCQAKFIIMI